MRLARQRAADVSLDGVQLAAFFRGGKAGGVAIRASARGTADSMHVVLDGVRQVVVDHSLNVGHVDPASCDVRGNQDAIAAATKALERLAPL